jgi:DNA-binding LytR/AlgR family response regulator
MNIKCIIVEDEPLAVDVIKDFIAEVPFLELIAICNDAFAAMKVLQEQEIELMFLDIHLPKLKGLDFLKTLKSPPIIIITTAYSDFAVSSYEYNVLDYLLKPIEFSRFMIAINKVIEQNNRAKNLFLEPKNENEIDELYFTVNKKKARIQLDSILYIESQKENIKIVTENKTIITRYLISDIEKELPKQKFLRIHRSFIVALSKIDFIDANDVEIRGKEIPIGRNYKNFVLSTIGIK